MSSGSGSGPFSQLNTGAYVTESRIKYGKLVATALGATWLTLVGGWITVQRTVVNIHIRLLTAVQGALVEIIQATLGRGAGLIRGSWAQVYQSAVETEPILAPLTLVLEIALVVGIVVWFRQRAGVI